MKAENQKEIKGIYYNEISGNVYFVNKIENDKVHVSTVLTDKRNCIIKILNDNKLISLSVFSGNYTKEFINSI